MALEDSVSPHLLPPGPPFVGWDNDTVEMAESGRAP